MPQAIYGEKTIELHIRFFTDKIALGNGQIKQRHAWGQGTVTIIANKGPCTKSRVADC